MHTNTPHAEEASPGRAEPAELFPHLLWAVQPESLSRFLPALVKHHLPFKTPMFLSFTCDKTRQSWAACLSKRHIQKPLHYPTLLALLQRYQTQTSPKPLLFGQGNPCKMSTTESPSFLQFVSSFSCSFYVFPTATQHFRGHGLLFLTEWFSSDMINWQSKLEQLRKKHTKYHETFW